MGDFGCENWKFFEERFASYSIVGTLSSNVGPQSSLAAPLFPRVHWSSEIMMTRAGDANILRFCRPIEKQICMLCPRQVHRRLEFYYNTLFLLTK